MPLGQCLVHVFFLIYILYIYDAKKMSLSLQNVMTLIRIFILLLRTPPWLLGNSLSSLCLLQKDIYLLILTPG